MKIDGQKAKIDTTRTFTLTVVRVIIALSMGFLSIYIATKSKKIDEEIGQLILTFDVFLWLFFVITGVLLFKRLSKQENELSEMDDEEEEYEGKEAYWQDGKMGHRKRK
jgi:surface polysaccharide O-acyltransferase-like enzyme